MAFKRYKIDVGVQSLTKLTLEAWKSIELNGNPPLLYLYGGHLTKVVLDPMGHPQLEAMSRDSLRGLVAETSFWFRKTKDKDKKEEEWVEKEVFPLKDVIANMMGNPYGYVPNLLGITNIPNFAANGTLQMVPGYSQDTMQYYHPTFTGELAAIPAKPSHGDVIKARDLILSDLIVDFPFEDKMHDEAYVLTMLLQPFMRNMIKQFCPFFLIDKPQAGTGASLLAQSIITIVTGGKIGAASSMDLTGGEAEVSKKFLATFAQSPQVIFMDNIVGELDSKRLTETITSDYYKDRILGQSKMAQYPIRNLWIATGNNPKMTPDIIRRTIRLRLNANMARPESRSGWKHENLEFWISANLPKLIHACLLIIQYWISQGSNLAPITKGGGFDHWSQVMGGILGHLALDQPFLSNTKTMHSHLDDEGLSWQLLLKEWWKIYETKDVSASNVYTMLENTESEIFITHSSSENSQKAYMGKKLSSMKDKTIGEYTIKAAPSINNSKRYRLEKWDLE